MKIDICGEEIAVQALGAGASGAALGKIHAKSERYAFQSLIPLMAGGLVFAIPAGAAQAQTQLGPAEPIRIASMSADAGRADSKATSSDDARPEDSQDTIIVTGKSTLEEAEKRLGRVAGGVSVVDNSRAAEGGIRTNADVLAFQPGVYAQTDGNSDAIKISIRGSNINGASGGFRSGVLFLFDGLPVTGPGGTPYELFEPTGIGQTEIYRGGNAFDVGSDTLGGAINYVSTTGANASPLAVRVEGGSYGYAKGQISSGGTYGPLDYYLSIAGSRSDGYEYKSHGENKGVQANIGYQLSSNIKTTFYLRYRETDNYEQQLLTLSQFYTNPRGPNILYRSRDTGALFVGNKTTINFDGNSSLTAGIVLHSHPFTVNVINAVDAKYRNYTDLSGTIKYQRYDEIFGHSSVTTIGLFSLNHPGTPRLDYHAGLALSKLVPINSIYYQQKFSGSDNNFYISNDTEVLSGLHMQGGLSALRIWRWGQISYPTVSPAYDRTTWDLGSRFGLLYNALPSLQLFGNFSRSVEPPADWAIPKAAASNFASGAVTGQASTIAGLRNQTASTVEIGSRGHLPVIGTWSLSLYRAWVKDELLQQQVSIPIGTSGIGNPTAVQSNGSPTTHRGIEFGLDTVIWKNSAGDKISLTQSYTYSDFRYVGDAVFGKNTLPGIPKHYYQAQLSYNDRSGFYVNVDTEVSSRKYLDYADSQSAPTYALLNAKFGFKIPHSTANVFADLRNITNAHYVSVVTPVLSLRNTAIGTITPGYGSNFIVGVSFGL